MKTVSAILLVVAACVSASAQSPNPIYNYVKPESPPRLSILEIGRGVYAAKGDWGANVGFFVGRDGVFVIDAKATRKATARVVAEIGKITSKPIRTVAFTHSDSDAMNGFPAYPKTAEIVMGQKAWGEFSTNMDTYLEMDAPMDIYDLRPRPRLDPDLTFDGAVAFRFGSEPVELFQTGRGHTGGDTVIWFPEKAVAFIGDLVFVDREPLVQDRKNGRSFGLPAALDLLLQKSPPIRTFVPSHADPIGREVIERIKTYIEDVQARVTAFVDSGRDISELAAEFDVSARPEVEGAWVWPSLAATVYYELTRKRAVESLRIRK